MANPTAYYVDPGLQDRAAVTLTNTTTTAHSAHTAHGYATSDIVKVHGANEAAYNGPGFSITKIDNDNYDYTMLSDPGGSATGSPLASKVNSGAGTTGDPYPDTQYALDTITRGADGDEINIQKDTKEVLAAALDVTGNYGTPDIDQPLVFRPYDATRLDIGGVGVGEIDCNGTSMQSNGTNYTYKLNLKIHNGGSSTIVQTSIGAVIDCEVSNTTGNGIVAGADSVILNNHVYNFGATGISGSSSVVNGNYVVGDGSTPTNGISSAGTVCHNIVTQITGGTEGIQSTGKLTKIFSNSILADGTGTGSGIQVTAAREAQDIWDNLIEGFNGTGGAGIAGVSNSRQGMIFNNVAFGNVMDFENFGKLVELEDQNNVEAGATPFAKSGSDTFANRAVYFAPIAAYQGKALPTVLRFDQGGVQHADPAGGVVFLPRRSSSLIGR